MSHYTPEMNDGQHIFVFGSNLAGIHGAGAARQAHKHWGAEWHVGEGRTGNSYALPTKDRSIKTRTLTEIRASVRKFIEYAKTHTELTFLVTEVGCGLAGLNPQLVAPMFCDAPSNCKLPDSFRIFA